MLQVDRAGDGVSSRDEVEESQEAEERGARWEDQGVEEREERVRELKVRRCQEVRERVREVRVWVKRSCSSRRRRAEEGKAKDYALNLKKRKSPRKGKKTVGSERLLSSKSSREERSGKLLIRVSIKVKRCLIITC